MTPARPSDKVIILDRDGTVVVDRGYLADPDGLEFEAHAAEGLQWLHSHGYRLVVVTNQSGVGRGLIPLQCVLDMNARLNVMAEQIGVRLEGIYFCPHAPDEGCDCRKPAAGLMRQAAADLGFDPAYAVVIGDKESDVLFGRRAGAATILIASDPFDMVGTVADHVVPDLKVAARVVQEIHERSAP